MALPTDARTLENEGGAWLHVRTWNGVISLRATPAGPAAHLTARRAKPPTNVGCRGQPAAAIRMHASGSSAGHLPLIRSLASRYQSYGLALDDLVQEGALGLLDAIDRYDPCRSASFETYARFRIRRAICDALTEQARLIRLPKHIVERRRALDRAEARLMATGSR